VHNCTGLVLHFRPAAGFAHLEQISSQFDEYPREGLQCWNVLKYEMTQQTGMPFNTSVIVCRPLLGMASEGAWF